MTSDSDVSEPFGVTGRLCDWALNLKTIEVPQDVKYKAKLLILDGIGCGLIGAHLPWSETAARAIIEIEPSGSCSLFGWQDRLSGPAATLLNSTFIQAFELDDWHPYAPLHSAALLIPALLAANEHVKKVDKRTISGESFLLAVIVGLEAGPRIGLGLGGAELLSRGWHSGAVFGGPAVAVAVSKLLGLSPRQTEWAIGTACTQAGGLMSAQYGSMTKRMQHGFAARNGLLAALLARENYTGIEHVLECPYGGFFSTFWADPRSGQPTDKDLIFKTLGTEWQTHNILIKPYPLMAALHAPVDCVRHLQETYKGLLRNPEEVKGIKIELGEGAYKHGGWKVDCDRLEVTGAQMNASYAVALQLVDHEIFPTSFAPEKLNRASIFSLIRKIESIHEKTFDGTLKTRVTITLQDGNEVMEQVDMPRGVRPQLSDEEVIGKWTMGVGPLLSEQRRGVIQEAVLTIESLDSLDDLLSELRKPVLSILE